MLDSCSLRAALLCGLALIAPAMAGDCDDCTFERGKAALCEYHRSRQKEALKLFKKQVRSDDVKDRMAAYERLAHSTEEHSNAPTRDVAKELTKGLRDDSESVQAQCISLLMRGQHPDVAPPELLKRAKGLAKSWRSIDKAFQTVAEDPSVNKRDAQSYGDAVREFITLRPLLMALGSIEDEEAVELLVDFLDGQGDRMSRKLVSTAALAAIETGTRPGIEAAIRTLATIEAGVPFETLYDLTARDNRVTVATSVLVMVESPKKEDADAIRRRLARLARERDLTPPSGTGASATTLEWQQWLGEHAPSFPETREATGLPVYVEIPVLSGMLAFTKDVEVP